MQLPQPILEQIETTLSALGYELWGMEQQSTGKYPLIRFYLDKSGGISVDECAIASRQISSILDVEDPIHSAYTLEVSSPGAERPFFKLSQLQPYIGERINIKVKGLIDNRRNFQATLLSIEEQTLIIDQDGHQHRIPFDNIQKSHLIYTGKFS